MNTLQKNIYIRIWKYDSSGLGISCSPSYTTGRAFYLMISVTTTKSTKIREKIGFSSEVYIKSKWTEPGNLIKDANLYDWESWFVMGCWWPPIESLGRLVIAGEHSPKDARDALL